MTELEKRLQDAVQRGAVLTFAVDRKRFRIVEFREDVTVCCPANQKPSRLNRIRFLLDGATLGRLAEQARANPHTRAA